MVQSTDFADFMKASNALHCVSTESDVTKWKDSKCSCETSKKEFMCKHVIAVAIHLGIIPTPELNDDDLEIEKKHGAGRPKKAKKGEALKKN